MVPLSGTKSPQNRRALLFPAGMADGRVTGGRVLAVTGLGADLAAARAAAYDGDGRRPVRRDAGAPGHRLAGARAPR